MKDKQQVKDAINALYEGAGVKTQFKGQVNEEVAKVFGQLLIEIRRCTSALNWVPKPTGGPATIKWIARNLTRSIIQQFKDDISITCAKARILQYRTRLRLASLGV